MIPVKFPMLTLALLLAATAVRGEPPVSPSNVVLAIHGGAGPLPRAKMTPELRPRYEAALEEALRAGYAVIKGDGSSLDAVEAAIKVMEDSPLFNAGKGAVFTHEGRNELDASIMDGSTRRAGAVAGLTVVKNPIAAARAVMEKSGHVLLIGPGADQFARASGLEIVCPSYFRTEERWQQLQEALKRPGEGASRGGPSDRDLGTVGAVALDRLGHLAAGTSTGGMTNKRFGRVGDSPIIGAGTYADDATCAVSATGHGEFFIRYAVAYDIVALMKYKGLTVAQAADEVVNAKLREAGGEGGVIALDAKGNAALPFNSEGMYRGTITSDGRVKVSIYRE